MPPSMLAAIRVLDLTNVLSGPFATLHLALLGAEVVKIENPDGGDLARKLGNVPRLNEQLMGTSFLAQNANKKSLTLNLKQPEARDIFKKLVRTADVLVENFRPGVMDRLGLSWGLLREINPRLVYCAISGFGQTGPDAQKPAYDQIIQGLSGVMDVNGDERLHPLRCGFPVCDTVGGLTAALHISAALAGRARTGTGTFLDVSMLESAVSAMGWAVSNYLVSGVPPEPMGTQNATAAPSGTFEAADGPLNIAANRQRQFETLCDLLDRRDLLDDPRFTDRERRKRHRDELTGELNRALRRRTAGEWERILAPAGVPAARVVTVPQAVGLDQLEHRGFFTELPFPDGSGRVLKVSGGGVLHDGEPLRPTGPPPLLGDQNAERDALADRWNGRAENAVTP